jgi:hypothetical protein
MILLNTDRATHLWDSGPPNFGGHAYGLEPLTLPSTLHRLPEEPVEGAQAHRDDQVRLLGPLAAPPDRLPAPDTADQLFWFRWITGHQIAFVVWQELGGIIARGDTAQAPGRDATGRAARLVRAYSATLLYTGSCTREVYHRVIRPTMALQHPRFSGAWAPDYGPVRALLRGRAPGAPGETLDPLRRECALNATIHEGIADKLVPDERSLFQSSVGRGAAQNRNLLGALFDTYFLTIRAPLPHSAVLAQLVRRIRAVRADLDSNGLYPGSVSSRAEKPSALDTAEVGEIEEAMPLIFTAVAREAVETAGTQPPGP